MQRFVPIYVVTFVLSLHMGTILFINSSQLARFFPVEIVSLLFIIGAFGNFIFFLFVPQLIEQVGKRILLVFFLSLALTAALILGFAESALVAFIAFTLYSSVLFIIYYCLDIFLEEVSLDSRTGEIRGSYYTFYNLGIALGPLLLYLSSSSDDLSRVYATASLLLLPAILLVIFFFKSDRPKWHGLHPQHMSLPLRLWWQTLNVRRVTIVRVILEFFYALMVIYTPLYLHNVIGFNWVELGLIFAVMLLPFILFQWPAGELADRYWGEKELMSLGLFIAGSSLIIMPLLDKSFIAWILILFLSRIGASIIEVMTESFFFKQITAQDTRLISIFRLSRPGSIIAGALVGIISLSLFSFDKIFYILAFVVFLGLTQSLALKDTK